MKTKRSQYKLLADEIVVWKSRLRPSQETINRVYNEASKEGWNGVTLDIFNRDKFIESVGYDSELEENTEAN